MNKSDGSTMKFTASETIKSIREQRETRDILRNANAFQRASGKRERQALLYLKEKRIYDIVEFLIGNLLLRRPYDPYEYLGKLLDKYILSRSGLIETPFAFPFNTREIDTTIILSLSHI